MRSKYLVLLGALATVIVMAVYFYLHPSYKLSLEAKVYYSIGDYDSALETAQKAYEQNEYNRMAFTVLVQSKNAKKFLEFIRMAKEYYAKIETISQKETISNADRQKIKMLTQIVLESYKRLNATRLTDEVLVEDAKKYYENFVALHRRVFEQRSDDANATD